MCWIDFFIGFFIAFPLGGLFYIYMLHLYNINKNKK